MTTREHLVPYGLFAAMLASAGLPIYMHAPKYFLDEYDVSLASLGAVLFGLRLLDLVQDPALGWLAARLRQARGASVAAGAAVMTGSMLGLFAVAPPVAPLLWFALCLAMLFSAFSYLTICFYAQGVATAGRLEGHGHIRLAGWRETGTLLGIALAAIAPSLLGTMTPAPFAVFALVFSGIAFLATLAMRHEWQGGGSPVVTGLLPVLSDGNVRRLLLLALLNTAPVAVTSTLFLFFVESQLEAPGWEGPFLLLFFLSAAAAAPAWNLTAQRIGAKSALMAGMVLSIAAFAGAAFLGAGDVAAFALICLFSGAALGADMTLLPALFAARISKIAPEASQGFGLWSFVSKASLAVSAAVLLPLLDSAGYHAGEPVSDDVLSMLTNLYAVAPLLLKCGALALLALTPFEKAVSYSPNGAGS